MWGTGFFAAKFHPENSEIELKGLKYRNLGIGVISLVVGINHGMDSFCEFIARFVHGSRNISFHLRF